MNNDFSPDEWGSIESRWKEHYRRIDELADARASVRKGTPKSSRWWHYWAAAAVLLFLGSGAMWIVCSYQRPTPLDNTAMMLHYPTGNVESDVPIEETPPLAVVYKEKTAEPSSTRNFSTQNTQEQQCLSESPHEEEPDEVVYALEINEDAHGLCLASNADMDCDDISQMIAALLSYLPSTPQG